jgi:hypothetical protein
LNAFTARPLQEAGVGVFLVAEVKMNFELRRRVHKLNLSRFGVNHSL